MSKLLVVALLLLASCGGARPEPITAPAGAIEEGPDTPSQWPDLTTEQRRIWMRTVVLPKMSQVLRDFDATRFATVRCVTCHSSDRACKRTGQTGYVQVECTFCHGEDGMAGDFKMPNPGLPRLSPSLETDNPKYAMFMKAVVVPEMRRLVQRKRFGCDRCHKP